ncbi:MAG: hypothetical protein KC423_03295 [Anaerolineales bacterium]|nr:hypothetical protein [Anaerolineales bacterium]
MKSFGYFSRVLGGVGLKTAVNHIHALAGTDVIGEAFAGASWTLQMLQVVVVTRFHFS